MWKTIPNWENYEVNENGEVLNKTTHKLISGDINNAGYYRVCLYNKTLKQRFFRHRLVAELFIDNPNNYTEINHIDGDKSNNSISNLEWCTRQHNEREARRTHIKEYKPYIVIFNDGTQKKYEFAIDLANELKITKRAVQNYLKGISKGYLKKGISQIKYI